MPSEKWNQKRGGLHYHKGLEQLSRILLYSASVRAELAAARHGIRGSIPNTLASTRD